MILGLPRAEAARRVAREALRAGRGLVVDPGLRQGAGCALLAIFGVSLSTAGLCWLVMGWRGPRRAAALSLGAAFVLAGGCLLEALRSECRG